MRTFWVTVIALVLLITSGVGAAGADPEGPTTTEEWLASMVTNEVEPGVFRVINDGVRDLTSTEAVDIVAGYDGGIWLLQEDEFLRLGGDAGHAWPAGSGPDDHVFEVAPDGTMSVIPSISKYLPDMRTDAGLRSNDGEVWTAQSCPTGCDGYTVAPDGTAWASWSEDGLWRVGHLGPTVWQPLDGYLPQDWSPGGFGRLLFTDDGDLYGTVCMWTCVLYRFEDGVWLRERDAYELVDVGPDGTIWQDGGISEAVMAASFPGDGLARFSGGEWSTWDSADLPDIRYGLAIDRQFEAAPDGSLWFSLWRSADGTDPQAGQYWRWEERTAAVEDGRLICDGLARFDGDTLDHFLRGQCVSMDIAADGSVWVLADDKEDGKSLYVITPEAVS